MKTSKTSRLLLFLKKGGTVTPKQAWKFWGLYRLADSVLKLRRRGYSIVTEIVRKKGDNYARYSIKKS